MTTTTNTGGRMGPVLSRAIRPRRVSFDFSSTPLHWVPGDPVTTHLINVLHLLLPAGERWFVRDYHEALPFITDPTLREQVKGFMGQEAVHARSHQVFLDHLRTQGIDTQDYCAWVEWLVDTVLAPSHTPLEARLAIISAIEHFTCVLGAWILESQPLDEAGADPVMLDLLRWHGAEEVEHRAVAFDVLTHLAGRRAYLSRVAGMAITFPMLWLYWRQGMVYLWRRDPTLEGKRYSIWQYVQRAREGRLPGWRILAAIPRYLRPGHHPSHEAKTERATEYLAVSPAALAAGS